MSDEVVKLENTYIEILNDAQKKLSGIVIPSMGLINNEIKVQINSDECFNNNSDKER